MSINCTWEEFKQIAKEFHNAMPTLNLEELENGWKCLALGYLGMSEPMWAVSAAILLKMEAKPYMQRLTELTAETVV